MIDRMREALAELEDMHAAIEHAMLTWSENDLGISFEQAAVARDGVWRAFTTLSDAVDAAEDEA